MLHCHSAASRKDAAREQWSLGAEDDSAAGATARRQRMACVHVPEGASASVEMHAGKEKNAIVTAEHFNLDDTG